MKLENIFEQRKNRSLSIIALAVVLLLMVAIPGLAQGPETMNFQGWLLDSSGQPRGGETHCMRFRMCSNSDCNTQVWPSSGYETHVVTTESGAYKAGLFNVALGSTTAIPPSLMYDHDTLYVEVGVADEAACPGSTWTTLTPRSQLHTSAYAHLSQRVSAYESDEEALVWVQNTGQGSGAYFRTDSTTNGEAAGRFEAQGSAGQTYGVFASNSSTTDSAAAGKFLAISVSGNTSGVYAENASTSDFASAGTFHATGSSGETFGIYVQNDSTDNSSAAGYFIAYGSSGKNYGVYGENNSTTDGAAAGYFTANGTSGKTYGVQVTNNSTNNGAAAGYFWATGTSGWTEGVHVRNDSTTDGARAGHFLANGTSGKTYSVVGLNHSSFSDSVAGYFHADYGVGLFAWSDYGNIIEAYSSSTDREFYVANDGEVYADGSFHNTGADFAEMMPGAEGLEPGDVLAVGLEGDLIQSTQAYQLTVVGVYSTEPGFVGGSNEAMENPGKVPLAIVGIVPVKISAENGPIQPGDLLVAADTPGHAMRGGEDPPQGTVIGKALESFEGETGTIRMLVTLQ